mmetsp:Transcript_35288/g.69642  ORF Transcript_35288/g.69642 Transcript_35288/m.69642 type:complete len:211 (-) Transcript_35288:1011-1643(-)
MKCPHGSCSTHNRHPLRETQTHQVHPGFHCVDRRGPGKVCHNGNGGLQHAEALRIRLLCGRVSPPWTESESDGGASSFPVRGHNEGIVQGLCACQHNQVRPCQGGETGLDDRQFLHRCIRPLVALPVFLGREADASTVAPTSKVRLSERGRALPRQPHQLSVGRLHCSPIAAAAAASQQLLHGSSDLIPVRRVAGRGRDGVLKELGGRDF